ncbi:MAG: hypothetical protein JNL98_37965 [Bryobacterales bacterium]|nr:hypothetical protein [Bryobacterales bacterium]
MFTWVGSKCGIPGVNVPLTVQQAVYVYDSTPIIDSVTQYPDEPNGSFYVVIAGRNFGTGGNLAVCKVFPCTPDFDIVVDRTIDPVTYWNPDQIIARLTPRPDALGDYLVQLTATTGPTGSSFQGGGPRSSQGTSNQKGTISLDVRIDRFDVSQVPTPNAVDNTIPQVAPIGIANMVSTFADRNSPDLLTVLQNSSTVTVRAINVRPSGAANQLRWSIDRDPTDTVASGVPQLSAATGAQISLEPGIPGNFRVVGYVDRNANGRFDETEQLRVLRIAIVRATMQPGSIFRVRNTLRPSGPASAITSITDAPMTLFAAYLLEGGGPNRQVGTDSIKLGNVGNLAGDTFVINYPGTTAGIGRESPGGPLPMVDTQRVTVNNEPSGGDTAFRTNSQNAPPEVLPPAPATGGLMAGVVSGDAPRFIWNQFHPSTGNPWGTTTGGNVFREFVVAFSATFPATYLALQQADWAVSVVGENDSEWADTGSSITGSNSLQLPTEPVQVRGRSFARQNTKVYTP